MAPSGASCGIRGSASNGNSAKIGITAISCINSTEKAERPPPVWIRPFSLRVCSTIAVELSATTSPTASATDQYSPNTSIAPPITASVVRAICSPPSPNNLCRISHSARGSSSSPIRNSIITTPNSAKCCRSCTLSPTSPSTGPITIPAAKYPKTDPSPNRAAKGTAITAAAK